MRFICMTINESYRQNNFKLLRKSHLYFDYLFSPQREIDILKMDIESDEWKCLRHMLAEGTLRKYVRQLDVEYHVIVHTPESLRRYYSIAKWLERQGFRIFHSRRNPYCQECWEMSYINSNLVKLTLN